jgi:integrase
MSNQPQTISRTRFYTRNDFTALRAYVQRVPAATIARLYFHEDENGDVPTAANVDRYLRDMQADLVALAIEHGSSVLADHLKASAKKHGSARLTSISLKMVEDVAKLAAAKPAADHGVGMWFKPLVARHLKEIKILTLGDLVAFCNRRGGSWWRAVPRVGAGRARLIVAWLRRHSDSLGTMVEADVDLNDPLKGDESQIIEVGGVHQVLAPLERMSLRRELSGADGENRSPAFAYIAARHDLDAVRSYLNQFREQPKTLRAYTKELERFLLWAVCVRDKPLSSLLVDDCEAYKDFLMAPLPAFVGPRAARTSIRWRPFAIDTASPETRKYAVRSLRAAFTWLVDVRYLAGNPWKAVKDPWVVEREVDMKVDRALSMNLWEQIRDHVDQASADSGAQRWRTVRALLLLMGDSGLRREEAATARREKLRRSVLPDDDEPIWELTVIGKRKKERTVPVSPATVDALRAHWADRERNFDASEANGPLLSPIIIPNTPQALKKHGSKLDRDERTSDGQKTMVDLPYSIDIMNRLVDWARKRLIAELGTLTPDAYAQLVSMSPHAFRHTFGTQSIAADVPLDVVQKVLGHRSLGTTSIYVQAEKQRMLKTVGKFYSKKKTSNTG